MRLHDLAVIINSSNAANRYQTAYQHQAQAAQTQDIMKHNEDAERRVTQTQEPEHEPNLKDIKEDDEKSRKWKKEPEDTEKREQLNNAAADKEADVKARMIASSDHIIDIRA